MVRFAQNTETFSLLWLTVLLVTVLHSAKSPIFTIVHAAPPLHQEGGAVSRGEAVNRNDEGGGAGAGYSVNSQRPKSLFGKLSFRQQWSLHQDGKIAADRMAPCTGGRGGIGNHMPSIAEDQASVHRSGPSSLSSASSPSHLRQSGTTLAGSYSHSDMKRPVAESGMTASSLATTASSSSASSHNSLPVLSGDSILGVSSNSDHLVPLYPRIQSHNPPQPNNNPTSESHHLDVHDASPSADNELSDEISRYLAETFNIGVPSSQWPNIQYSYPEDRVVVTLNRPISKSQLAFETLKRSPLSSETSRAGFGGYEKSFTYNHPPPPPPPSQNIRSYSTITIGSESSSLDHSRPTYDDDVRASPLPQQDRPPVRGPVEDQITRDSETALHSADENAMNALINLPDDIIRLLWDTHGYMEARPLARVSKSLSKSIHRSSARQFQYQAKFILPSILFCISHKDEECLCYWTPSLSELNDRYLYVILVALAFDPWSPETPIVKDFLSAIYPRISPYSKYLIHKLKTLKLMEARLLTIEYLLPLPHDIIGQLTADSTRALCEPVLRAIVGLLEEEFAAMELTAFSDECPSIRLDMIDVQRQKYKRLIAAFMQDFSPINSSPATVLSVIHAFLAYAKVETNRRHEAYLFFTEKIMNQMDSLSSLDEIKSTEYPLDQFCSVDPFYSRMIDQARYPYVSNRLGQAAVVHRRLDILRTMIRDEGLLFFTSPSLLVMRDPHAVIGTMEQYNILIFAMHNLLSKSHDAHHHESWGPSPLPFLQLLLEDGGLRLIYPQFLSDAVRLGDLEVLRYLVQDLGVIVGIQEALGVAQTAQNEEMVNLLVSQMLARTRDANVGSAGSISSRSSSVRGSSFDQSSRDDFHR